MEKIKTKDLVLMAFYIALFMVLDVFVNTLAIFQMPNGGSLGVSTIALLLASYHLGWKKGLMVSVLSVFLQFMTGPMYTPDFLGFMLDYFLAFSVYGLASLFPNISYVYSGVILTNVVRFICSTISGVVVWKLDIWGSIVYQSTYMIPTLILGVILIPLVCKYLKPYMEK